MYECIHQVCSFIININFKQLTDFTVCYKLLKKKKNVFGSEIIISLPIYDIKTKMYLNLTFVMNIT